jgi:hypothetical protein
VKNRDYTPNPGSASRGIAVAVEQSRKSQKIYPQGYKYLDRVGVFGRLDQF